MTSSFRKNVLIRIMSTVLFLSIIVLSFSYCFAAQSAQFIDINETDWYYEWVVMAAELGIMNGIGDNLFAPNMPLSRAMMVTILWRLVDSPLVDGKQFIDVYEGSWYHNAVTWAYENGITMGTAENYFSPEEELTRQQMMVFIYRFAKEHELELGYNTEYVWLEALDRYTDRATIADYALDALRWSKTYGLIHTNGEQINATYPATRADVAYSIVSLMRNVINRTAIIPCCLYDTSYNDNTPRFTFYEDGHFAVAVNYGSYIQTIADGTQYYVKEIDGNANGFDTRYAIICDLGNNYNQYNLPVRCFELKQIKDKWYLDYTESDSPLPTGFGVNIPGEGFSEGADFIIVQKDKQRFIDLKKEYNVGDNVFPLPSHFYIDGLQYKSDGRDLKLRFDLGKESARIQFISESGIDFEGVLHYIPSFTEDGEGKTIKYGVELRDKVGNLYAMIYDDSWRGDSWHVWIEPIHETIEVSSDMIVVNIK